METENFSSTIVRLGSLARQPGVHDVQRGPVLHASQHGTQVFIGTRACRAHQTALVGMAVSVDSTQRERGFCLHDLDLGGLIFAQEGMETRAPIESTCLGRVAGIEIDGQEILVTDIHRTAVS